MILQIKEACEQRKIARVGAGVSATLYQLQPLRWPYLPSSGSLCLLYWPKWHVRFAAYIPSLGGAYVSGGSTCAPGHGGREILSCSNTAFQLEDCRILCDPQPSYLPGMDQPIAESVIRCMQFFQSLLTSWATSEGLDESGGDEKRIKSQQLQDEFDRFKVWVCPVSARIIDIFLSSHKASLKVETLMWHLRTV